MQWLFGNIAAVNEVTVQRSRTSEIEAEEIGSAVLAMKNEVSGCLKWSAAQSNTEQQTNLTLFTEKGTIKLMGEYFQTLEFTDTGKSHETSGEVDGLSKLYTSMYQHLVQSLNEKDNHFTSAFDALGSVEIIETIYKAAIQP
jgi:predicted dehydrogenase